MRSRPSKSTLKIALTGDMRGTGYQDGRIVGYYGETLSASPTR
jgi:hypothetical protein